MNIDPFLSRHARLHRRRRIPIDVLLLLFCIGMVVGLALHLLLQRVA